MNVETISRKEAIAWLAGIMDGEGTIHAFWGKQQAHMTGPGMRVNVLIGGCNPRLLHRVSTFLQQLEVGFSSQAFKPRGGRKQALQIVIAGKGRVKKFLELVSPYLTEKRDQALLALKLIEYRESLNHTYGVQGEKKYTLHEDPTIISLIQHIKDDKVKDYGIHKLSRKPSEELGGQSSETIRRQLGIIPVMIESDPCSDVRTLAETTKAPRKGSVGGIVPSEVTA